MRYFILSVLALSFVSQSALALTHLRGIEQVGQNEFRVDLDQGIKPGQMKVDYLRDIVQISIKGLSVYPAKVVNPAQSEVRRIFAYQFTPELVRIRFTVPDRAEAYRGRVDVRSQGRTLRVSVKRPVPVAKKVTPAPKAKEEDVVLTSAAQAVEPEPLSKEETKLLEDEIPRPESLPSPLKAFGWLMGCILLFGAGAFLLRFLFVQIKKGGFFKGKGKVSQILEKVAQSVPGGQKPIEVLSTKYLGPKRSLCVVRVKGRTLLIGTTQESINLIADLTEDESNEELEELAQAPALLSSSGTGATAAGPAVFAKYLQQETVKEEEVQVAPEPAKRVTPGIREQIRKKVEGMKSL